jgi:hypothetical protein
MSGNGWTSSPAGATIGSMSEPDAVPLPREGEVFFDVRGEARSMRLSWYAESRIAVFSIWQGNRCTGTFRLPFGELARMVRILQAGPRPYAAAGARSVAAHRDPGPSRGYGTGHGHGADQGYGTGPDYSAVPRYGHGARAGYGPSRPPPGRAPAGAYAPDELEGAGHGAGQGHGPAGHEAPYGLSAEPVTGAGSPDYLDVPRRRGPASAAGATWSPARPDPAPGWPGAPQNEPRPGARHADPETSGLRQAVPAHIAQVESSWLGAPEPGQDSRPSDTNLLGFPAAPGWHRSADSG